MRQISTQSKLTSLKDIRDTDDGIQVFSRLDTIDPRIYKILKKGMTGDLKFLNENINTLFNSGYYSNKASTLSNIIAFFGIRENREALGNILLSSTEAMQLIYENSYYHQNGFQKIVLLESDFFKLRFHIFEECNGIISQENIHNHRWPFSSIVLNGMLRFNLYEENEKGDILKFDNDYSSGNKQNYQVVEKGKCKLSLTNSLDMESWYGYYLNKDCPHQIVSLSHKRTHTLVLTGIPENEICKLYSEEQFDSTKTGKPKISMLDLENAIEEFKIL